MKTTKVGVLEDDPAQDPFAFFDVLPEPYNFISQWLESLIIKNAFERIIQIEQKKKNPEYEGMLKTVYSTGFAEINGITSVNSLHTRELRTNKFVLGDKFGTIHMLDSSRKIVLDKQTIFSERRIVDISSASIPWVDTFLSTIVVIARASPEIKILYNKNNESKMYHYYTIKGVSPDVLDDGVVKPETSYLNFPSKIKISKDGLFLLVTTYGGKVHFLKLPDILNPMKKEDLAPQVQVEPGQAPANEPTVSNFLKTEIDSFEHKVLQFNTLLRQTVANKEMPTEFKDPYDPKAEPVDEEPVIESKDAKAQQKKPAGKDQPKETEENEPKDDLSNGPKLEYKVGKYKKDGDLGDAGILFRNKGPIPHAYFVRSQYYSKSEDHTNRQLKKWMITTKFVIAYQKLSIVEVYSIQKCSKDNCPKDYTYNFFQTIFMKKKNDEKKKKESSLATLIKTARQDINNQQDKNAVLTEEEKKAKEKPIITFKPFFMIESSEYLDLDEEAQYLAIGMINGGTIIYDLNVGVEKWILEWHGGPVTSISFYQDKEIKQYKFF